SNMVGQAEVSHLEMLLNDTETHDEIAPLWNEETESWRERDDVYCRFDQHASGHKKLGKLVPGFGSLYAEGTKFGPELGFGNVMGDSVECRCEEDSRAKILLLKTAEGGKCLAIDFRPPSSGMPTVGEYPSHKGKDNLYNATGPGPFNEASYGHYYRLMLSDLSDTLSDLPRIIPGYTSEQGYNIEGVVWFQGWNDMIKENKVHEYAYNLANFIRDVRKDLGIPSLPFIIGELGQNGLHPENDKIQKMRKAQESVANLDDLRNNTLFVRTAQYVTDEEPTFNGDYHYNGRADTMYSIGRAFGDGMLQLLSAKEESGHRMLRSSAESTQSSFWRF
ncbi:MAG: hypothetical protein SGILL_009552, partial [Bacillariaceae sp.]